MFQLNINEKSEVIETPLAIHIIILQDIQPSYQLKLDEAKNQIIDIITSVELNNYFSDLYDDINSKIEFRCIEIDKLSNHTIFGYGFPENFDINYNEIKPSAKNIGLLSMEKKNCYKENSIDNINPIYLAVEK